MTEVIRSRHGRRKKKTYLDAPYCSECKSRNVYYRKETNDYLCRRCGAVSIRAPEKRKE